MSEKKKTEKDPLHYFMSNDDLSGSSSDSESETDRETRKRKGTGSDLRGGGEEGHGTKRTAGGAPLPKPDVLFKSVSKPAFLYNPLNKHIDWESRIVKAPEEPAKEFKVWKTNAVPPPQSYTPEVKKTAPPGMDMAIKWSNVYEDNGDDAPQPAAGKAIFLPEEEAVDDPCDSDEDKTMDPSKSGKKRKVESFQQKEKRKRDLGQATSDKSFVEEEKRILRQNFC
ncbi:UPF0690 protein C1orf52 homolog [Brienomyrus brachyistius]|uniref:UPF0690 protein C1orf52 homolog n=1 Tax=Brienomyrus brachyistius TaxID=42636 RepID=UPI0020B2BD87|nr:UPF0690 protein C1orf52 homolog [Brienomyrus brachyistius]